MFNRLFQSGKNLISKENSSILSAAAVIMFASLISALLGFIRTRLLIGYFFADKSVLDIFWAAFRIPEGAGPQGVSGIGPYRPFPGRGLCFYPPG